MDKVGFMGLGAMGLPMASNLAKAGLDLMVFNRSPAKAEPLKKQCVQVAASCHELIDWADIVVMMLSGPEAIEATLGERLASAPQMLAGKLVVNMGTNPPSYSETLAGRLAQAGAAFVEAPVLGTQEPAVQGTLLVMTSGPRQAQKKLEPIFDAVGSQSVYCGQVPKAGMMKLAVNLVLSAALEGLFEGTHFAQKAGLDLDTYFQLILNSPLGNPVFALKAKKLLERDYAPQASLGTVREMLKHIADTAHDIGAFIPGTLGNLNLSTMAINQGLAGEDACAMIKVFDK
jgi:3-hydroxyisobutyrate dehydrogenase